MNVAARICLAGIALVISRSCLAQEKLDRIILVNGARVVGQIVEERPDSSVVIRFQSGSTMEIPRNQICEVGSIVVAAPTKPTETFRPVANSVAREPIWTLLLLNSEEIGEAAFDSVCGTNIHITVNQRTIVVPADSLQQIDSDHANHVLIGAGAGTVAGMVIGRAAYKEKPDNPDATPLVAGVKETFDKVGAGANVLGGALIGLAGGALAGIIWRENTVAAWDYECDGNVDNTLSHLKKIFDCSD